MNEEQSMFAEMLGIRKMPCVKPVKKTRPISPERVEAEDVVDELEVQKEVVEAMALEKAQLEEDRAALEAEKLNLEREKRELEAEKAELQGRVSALEADFAALEKELECSRAGNDELEAKLARMGKSLAAARRAAAESKAFRTAGGAMA